MTARYVIAVTGGRRRIEAAGVWAALDRQVESLEPFDEILVVQGGCPTGVDYRVRQWADERGVPCASVNAPWKKYGPSAGPRRNGWMIVLFQPDVLLAFPGERGTEDCVAKAEAAHVPVQRYDTWGALVE